MTLTVYALLMIFTWGKLLDPHNYGRFVRAVNMTQANTITISRHMTLARVFSALYLQVQLTNKKMNRKDIVANVWNLENSRDLDKFVSLKFEGVSEQLTSFSASISESPHANETEMIEFRADYERFLGFKRQDLSTVVTIYQFPALPQTIIIYAIDPKRFNVVDHILELIGLLETEGYTDWERDWLEEYLKYFRGLFADGYQTDELEEAVNPMLALETKLSAAMAFFDLQDSLTRIQNMLPKLEKIVNHQKSLSAVSKTTNTIHLLEELYLVFSLFDKPLTSVPIGHALHRRLNLTQIQLDIKDKWVEGVLNNTEMLQKLSDYYTNGKSALHPIELITMDSDILFDRNNYNMIRFFVKGFKIIQRSKSINNIENMANRDCLTLLDKSISRQDIEKLLEITRAYRRIKEAFFQYDDTRFSIPNRDLLVQELDDIIRQFPSSIVFTDQNWELLRHIKKFVSNHRDDYEKIKPQEDVLRDLITVEGLDDSINLLLFYVLDKMEQLKIHEQRCDSMFNLDLAEIDYIVNIAKFINNIKPEGTTKKVIKFVAAVEKIQKSLNELGEESEIRTKKPSKRSIDEVALKEDPSLLLNYSYAASSLEQLNELYDQLSLLIRKGDNVVDVIRKMRDSEDKTELNNAWTNFTTLRKKLVEFQTKSIKILARVNMRKFSQPERTLQQVGLVYKEISVILIAGSFDMRKMRESMILLNPRIPDVENALVHLETPLAMNWNLVQRSFESVPDVLFAIQKIQQVTPTTEPQTMTKYIIIGIAVTLGIIVVAIIVVLVCCWMNRKDPDVKLDLPPEKAYVAPPGIFINSRDPCRDAAGEDCDTWAHYNGVDQISKEYHELNRNPSTKLRQIIPKNTPKTWNVLVLNDCKFKDYKRRKLPLRIKKSIIWGNVNGKDLDEFTHIVLPPNKTVLMNRDWLEALVKMKDKAMDEDYNWYVLNTRYNGKTHRDTICNIKKNHYRMVVRRLLKNADICILPSTSKNSEKNRFQWKKIIEMFGGTYVNMTDIKPDGPKTITPYWTRTEAYKGEMHEFSQNARCWILKTKGCRINGKWRKDHGMYTLADFKFLTESIARNCILQKKNDVVLLDYEGNSVSRESKGTSSTVKSSTTTTPVKSRMAAMKDTEMKKRQQEMRKEIKKTSSKATVNQ